MWHALRVPPHELRLGMTLANGQCFGWQRCGDEWLGAIGDAAFSLKETAEDVLANCLNQPADTAIPLLHSFLNLQEKLQPHKVRWAKADPKLKIIAEQLTGMRVLRQDPLECLFSFITSSNNNIQRITQLLNKLRETHGKLLYTGVKKIYSFPAVNDLAALSEDHYRQLGFGYRAKFLRETALLLKSQGDREYLLSLRTKPLSEVTSALLQYQGVGRKVADCVALFSLDKAEAVPVDTHVWHIACRDFDPSLAITRASVTPQIYDRVSNLFRERYGSHAGWAHCLLFAAELPQYLPLLPADMQAEYKAFAKSSKEQKASKIKDKKEQKTQQEQQQKKSKGVKRAKEEAKAQEDEHADRKKNKTGKKTTDAKSTKTSVRAAKSGSKHDRVSAIGEAEENKNQAQNTTAHKAKRSKTKQPE